MRWRYTNRLILLSNTFNEEALVEPYLEGRNFRSPCLAILRKSYQYLNQTIQCCQKICLLILEVKWFYELATSGKHLKCPAKIPAELEKNQ